MLEGSFLRRLASALLALLAATAAVAEQRLLPAQSEIVFVSRQMGVPVQGHFRRFDAQLNFDPQRPQASTVRLSVDTGSATLGTPEADAELPKPEWFHTARFPQAIFQSTVVKALGGGRYEVAGRLTIKGLSQELVVPVQLTQAGGLTTATGGFTLKRLAFRIGEGAWSDTSMVADEVQVRFRLALAGVGKL
jgi:polyisoprenoid-binding protein YceI